MSSVRRIGCQFENVWIDVGLGRDGNEVLEGGVVADIDTGLWTGEDAGMDVVCHMEEMGPAVVVNSGGRCVSDGQFSVPGVRGERRLEGGMWAARGWQGRHESV